MSGDHFGLATLLVLFGVVAFGAVVPVLPTGAAVSSAAVLARADHTWEVVLVVAVGAGAAYCGDLVTYAALRRAGEPLARRVGWLGDDGDEHSRPARLRERIEHAEIRTLLVSRLVPGGRVPVLLVAALTGYPWYRYVSAAAVAAALWATVYAAVGVLGDGLFDDTRTALVVAVGGALLVSVVPQLVRRLRPHPRG
ncbi:MULTISPECIES: VTT domain-containing protein [unclassified Nocardioides]|uniref:VTT domain-containing protein n=1 Tax=unclassified Nocardioides TaxID=2615069 RepID=UPI00301503E0